MGESALSRDQFCDGLNWKMRVLSPCNQEGQREVKRGLCLCPDDSSPCLSPQTKAMCWHFALPSSKPSPFNQCRPSKRCRADQLLWEQVPRCLRAVWDYSSCTSGKLWRKLLFVQAPLLCQLGSLKAQDPALSPELLPGNSAEPPQKCCI